MKNPLWARISKLETFSCTSMTKHSHLLGLAGSQAWEGWQTRSSAMNIAPWINYKWYDKWIDWWQMYRLYNWVDTRRNIFLLYVGALPRPLLAKFTSIYLNTSWFYSIYLNLSRFTSIYHGLPQFTHRWRCKQMVFKQLQITHEWQTSCKTCHKMALLTDINHTLWKVNHYVTKNSKKNTTPGILKFNYMRECN